MLRYTSAPVSETFATETNIKWLHILLIATVKSPRNEAIDVGVRGGEYYNKFIGNTTRPRMSTTVTSKGQITIPKHIRDSAEMTPGSKIDFVVNDRGRIEIVKEGEALTERE